MAERDNVYPEGQGSPHVMTRSTWGLGSGPSPGVRGLELDAPCITSRFRVLASLSWTSAVTKEQHLRLGVGMRPEVMQPGDDY
jgi:hypothetical protein